MFTISLQNHFDKIEKDYQRKTNRALFRSGAYTRAVSRSLVKKGKSVDGVQVPSKPGTPPFSWEQPGMTFRDSILYEVDRASQTVVVGAIGWGRNKTIGQTHEYGGTETVTVWEEDSTGTKRRKRVKAHYPKRPFLAPAWEKSESKVAEFWKQL